MADEAPTTQEPEVKAFDRLGNKISVPASKVGELEQLGGRVASAQEVAEAKAEADYDKLSAAQKARGFLSGISPQGFVVNAVATAAYNKASGENVSIAPHLPPSLEGYVQGVSRGYMGGLPTAAIHEAVKQVSGPEAAKAYAEQVQTAVKAHDGLYTAGEVAGLVGGIAGPIGKVGGAAEAATGRVVGGLAARGAMGRAAASAATLGVRGAAEGAMYGAANQITEDALGDRELVADKIFASAGLGVLYGGAGGAVLGAGGSLLRSGVGGLASRVRGAAEGEARVASKALGEAGSRVEAAAGEARSAAEDAVSKAKGAAEAATTEAKAQINSAIDSTAKVTKATGILEDLRTPEGVRKLANEQAFKAFGAGNGFQPTKYVKQAKRILPNGEADLGEVALRRGIIPNEGASAAEAAAGAFRVGRPADRLERVLAEHELVGSQIGQMTEASTARVRVGDLMDDINAILKPIEAKGGMEHIARGVREYRDSLMSKFGVGGQPSAAYIESSRALGMTDEQILAAFQKDTLNSTISVQDALFQRKALDELAFKEAKALDPNLRVEALREFRTKFEQRITDAMDAASGDMKGAFADQYKTLKRDYVALSILKDLAEDSAARMAKAGTLSLTDKIGVAGAIAGGHLMAAPVVAVGSKLIRERGNAAAAVLLSRMADMGTLTNAVKAFDDMAAKAARGVLEMPKPMPAADLGGNVRVQAQKEAANLAALQADQAQIIARITQATEPMSQNAPNVAGAVTRRMTDALAFAVSRAPRAKDVDPFDPHPAPKMSDAEAASFVRTMQYVRQPSRFFVEAAHGKITYEGVQVARTLMPQAFAELQQRVAESMADMMGRGKTVPYRQRERLGILLDIPAVPSQRPEHMRLLQSNVVGSEQAEKATSTGAQPKRPTSMPTQRSLLDRLEDKKR